MTSALADFHTPAVGFDAPFEMLCACHERVQRTLALLERLRAHVRRQGGDNDDARKAARDVLRYFDLAAPMHHEDEELHIFPPLLAHGSAEVVAQVERLQQDHQQMSERWARARAVLQALEQGRQSRWSAEDEEALQDFASLYADHIALEEGSIYPAVRSVLAPEAIGPMGAEMAWRRGQRKRW